MIRASARGRMCACVRAVSVSMQAPSAHLVRRGDRVGIVVEVPRDLPELLDDEAHDSKHGLCVCVCVCVF